ncbi:MAG: MerR family transcriptional regulator [Crocinitomicaceae bacterium]
MGKINYDTITKLYYSIGEVADLFDVSTSLIRFWEKEFTIIRPKKNKNGNRLFTPGDIKSFEKIYVLVKEQGFTLDGAKKVLKSKTPIDLETPSASSSNDVVIQKLENIKSKLLQLTLDYNFLFYIVFR